LLQPDRPARHHRPPRPIKELGFKEATRAGLSFAAEDLRLPEKKKEILATTEKEVDRIQKLYAKASSPRASGTTKLLTPGLMPARSSATP